MKRKKLVVEGAEYKAIVVKSVTEARPIFEVIEEEMLALGADPKSIVVNVGRGRITARKDEPD